ncbi:hypothetical protein BDR07DRAFT_1378719 [Suillus spraguei]|nr:hypothetical protein BDR07DRAFT_1378719 [Suillus spraguei]
MTPTDERSHPTGLLVCDALPNQQDFNSIISDTKSIVDTRTDFYDRSLKSRRYAFVGLACSSIFSCSCIVTGIAILAKHGVIGTAVGNLVHTEEGLTQLLLQKEILNLALNVTVTLCTESIGFVHGISLRSALASESRLRFNTNLHLLTAARGWYHPNGTLHNGILVVLLIISYSSASLVVCVDETRSGDGMAFAGLPILILSVALLLQVMIAVSGIQAVKILTWSSSPFDLTATLVHHMQLTPATSKCMRCVPDLDTDEGPAKPSEIQPSEWHAHRSTRKVVIFLWVIVVACAGWAAFVMHVWDKYPLTRSGSPDARTLQTWSFLPHNLSPCIVYFVPGVDLEMWILLLVNMAAIQGPLTLGLHLSELIANVFRDEKQGRCATGRKGLITATNPVKMIFTDPICLVLFVAKFFLRYSFLSNWMFGLSFSRHTPGKIEAPMVYMYTAQIWNLCIALFIFSRFFTFVALRRPHGPQPAAYGHVQTLANLVDEWSPVMWWGHKEDGIPYCHAGTSDHPLPDVKIDCVYAGSGAASLVPLS